MSTKAPTKLEQKAQAIAAIADKRTGRVSPQDVVEAARDPASPLHDEFEWNDAAAAARHRLETARKLIREVKFIVKIDDVRIASPYYVSDPRTDNSGYIPVSKIADKRAVAKRALLAELERIRGNITRARLIAVALGLESTFDYMLSTAVEAERALGDDIGDDRPSVNA